MSRIKVKRTGIKKDQKSKEFLVAEDHSLWLSGFLAFEDLQKFVNDRATNYVVEDFDVTDEGVFGDREYWLVLHIVRPETAAETAQRLERQRKAKAAAAKRTETLRRQALIKKAQAKEREFQEYRRLKALFEGDSSPQ